MWTSAAGRLRWTDSVEALIGRSGHLHVMGTVLTNPAAWSIIERAADVIRDRGGSISLDPNLRKELKADAETERRFATMIAMSDLLLPSGEELERAAGLDAALFSRMVTSDLLAAGDAALEARLKKIEDWNTSIKQGLPE